MCAWAFAKVAVRDAQLLRLFADEALVKYAELNGQNLRLASIGAGAREGLGRSWEGGAEGGLLGSWRKLRSWGICGLGDSVVILGEGRAKHIGGVV